MRYRVGDHYGIHIYEVAAGDDPEEDRPVATASTAADATKIVDALNGWERAFEKLPGDPWQSQGGGASRLGTW